MICQFWKLCQLYSSPFFVIFCKDAHVQKMFLSKVHHLYVMPEFLISYFYVIKTLYFLPLNPSISDVPQL